MVRMNPRPGIALAAGLIACCMATHATAVQIAASAEDEAALRAKVSRYVKGWVRSTGIKGAKYPKVILKLVDLNGDGTPEALVVLQGLTYCGMRGCSAFVLDLRGPSARSIGDFIAFTIDAHPGRTGGWRDIVIGGRHRIRYKNGKYGK